MPGERLHRGLVGVTQRKKSFSVMTGLELLSLSGQKQLWIQADCTFLDIFLGICVISKEEGRLEISTMHMNMNFKDYSLAISTIFY